ncbi:MAG: flavodoxin-dependent (E)-4-hydroxy-3-methylbut-2-enyl-diphosphate synthase, partial [Desulfovibrionaceae bacterium]|nr:flavodoxin-dependent (E)-4-hydroxy-3-methylbut-2-enyl-diphosphate synthase [Desulfovibrionaceae bacterium]
MPHGSKYTVRLGSLRVGGGSPVMVQSMTNTDTRDVEATLAQIDRLVARGCEAVRVAVPDQQAAGVLRELHDRSPVPLIADIHFDWRLAIRAIESGFEGLRINPGNIGQASRVAAVVDCAKASGAAIRVGVNSGSVEKDLLDKFGGPCPEAMVASALRHVHMVEERGFDQIVVSVKSSSVLDTVACYRQLAREIPWPLHLGVTEAGSLTRGTVKSSVGLGILLSEGIGDTIRVSLTAPPEDELDVAWEILRSLDLRRRGAEIISCPTCGRTEIDLLGLEKAVSERLRTCTADITVAVMGCVVNG